MSARDLNVLIGGEAGQGMASLSEIFCKALVRQGYSIVVTQDYMSRVRGGHNFFVIRISPGPITAPREKVDLLVALNRETVEIHRSDMAAESLVIAGREKDAEKKPDGVLEVPFDELTEAKFENVAGLGVLGSLLGLPRQALRETVLDYFGAKSDEIAKKNEDALAKSFAWVSDKNRYPFLKLDPAEQKSGRLMLNGNQAIALGALSAGLKFYAFYPMTPSTSIGVTLAAQMDKLPLVVEQAEDEIAAINMVVGASCAGVPAMTGTSGGGFALMVEALSLAGISETPVVIAIAQRPGPATGMPTRTEQGELEFVLHAGHGEFPRAILAPGNVEQCFHLTRKAFELAHQVQGPVFVLTDLFQADSYRAVEPFDIDSLDPVVSCADPAKVQTPYRRYRITESGVSPRLAPGKSQHLVINDSHEHDEAGHMSEDAEVRVRMVEKRLRKIKILEESALPPDFIGDERPNMLLVCWGSTRGSAIEAAAMIRQAGKTAAVLHFQQVWPLRPDAITERLESAGEVVGVESNATGQFIRLIQRETGLAIEKKILRYDGRVITPEYILRGLGIGGQGGAS